MQRHVDDGKQYIDVVNVGTKLVKALTGCAIIAGKSLGVCSANDVERGGAWDGRFCIFAICGPTDIPVGGHGRVSIDFPLPANVLQDAKRYRGSDVLVQPTEDGFTDLLHGDDVFEGLNHHRSFNLHYVLARGYEIGEHSLIDEWRSFGDGQYFGVDKIHWDTRNSSYGSGAAVGEYLDERSFTKDDSELRKVDVPDDYNGGFNSSRALGQVAFSAPLTGTAGSVDSDFRLRRIIFLEFGAYEITFRLKFNPFLTGVFFVNDGVLTNGIYTDGVSGGGNWFQFGGAARWVTGRSNFKLMVNRKDMEGCITKSTDDEFEFRPSHWIKKYDPGFGSSEVRAKVWIVKHSLWFYRVPNGDGDSFFEYYPSLDWGNTVWIYLGEAVVDEGTGETDWTEVVAALDAMGLEYTFIDVGGHQVLLYGRQYDLPPFNFGGGVQAFYRVTERLFVESSNSEPPRFDVVPKPEVEFKLVLVVGKDGKKVPGIVKSVLEVPIYYDAPSHVDAIGEYTFAEQTAFQRSHWVSGNISIRRLSADVIDLSEKHNASSGGGGSDGSGGGSGGGLNPLPEVGGG